MLRRTDDVNLNFKIKDKDLIQYLQQPVALAVISYLIEVNKKSPNFFTSLATKSDLEKTFNDRLFLAFRVGNDPISWEGRVKKALTDTELAAGYVKLARNIPIENEDAFRYFRKIANDLFKFIQDANVTIQIPDTNDASKFTTEKRHLWNDFRKAAGLDKLNAQQEQRVVELISGAMCYAVQSLLFESKEKHAIEVRQHLITKSFITFTTPIFARTSDQLPQYTNEFKEEQIKKSVEHALSSSTIIEKVKENNMGHLIKVSDHIKHGLAEILDVSERHLPAAIAFATLGKEATSILNNKISQLCQHIAIEPDSEARTLALTQVIDAAILHYQTRYNNGKKFHESSLLSTIDTLVVLKKYANQTQLGLITDLIEKKFCTYGDKKQLMRRASATPPASPLLSNRSINSEISRSNSNSSNNEMSSPESSPEISQNKISSSGRLFQSVANIVNNDPKPEITQKANETKPPRK